MTVGTKTRSGFTLVEMVVVVMILGILAAIAAPKLLGTSQAATDNGVRQSLSVIRDAIDRYAAEHNGVLPGADGLASTFEFEIAPYIRGGVLPKCPVDGSLENEVYVLTAGDTPGFNSGVGTHAWAYDYETGEIHVNCVDVSSDGVTTYDQF
jgi:general secretion pathway protein G